MVVRDSTAARSCLSLAAAARATVACDASSDATWTSSSSKLAALREYTLSDPMRRVAVSRLAPMVLRYPRSAAAGPHRGHRGSPAMSFTR